MTPDHLIAFIFTVIAAPLVLTAFINRGDKSGYLSFITVMILAHELGIYTF